MQFHLFCSWFFFISSLVYRKFYGRLLSICVFFPDRLIPVSPRMNAITSRDQFEPIRIGENLVVNYNI